MESNSALERLSVSQMMLGLSSQSVDALMSWTLQNWKPGQGIVQRVDLDSPERHLLVQTAKQAFQKRNVAVARLRTWFNIQEPDQTEGDYPSIYPHKHADESATTMVIYLDPGDVPSSLEILAEDKVVAVIEPEVGKAVLIPNGVWHQVPKNRGTRPRIALIVTAYPV